MLTCLYIDGMMDSFVTEDYDFVQLGIELNEDDTIGDWGPFVSLPFSIENTPYDRSKDQIFITLIGL